MSTRPETIGDMWRRIRPQIALKRPAPAPDAPPAIPHCNGRHGPDPDETGRACEWCDALTGVITAIRHLETRNERLEDRADRLQREVNVLRGRPAGDPPPKMPDAPNPQEER